MSKQDFAIYGSRRYLIEHQSWLDEKEFTEFLFNDANSAIKYHREGMTFHYIGDRRYITMAGQGSKTSGAIWSWRFLELRGVDEGGHPMVSTFDTVDEKHYSPVVFLDQENEDEEGVLSLQVFRPKDKVHYPLSSLGYQIQKLFLNLAESRGNGDLSVFRLDS